jgi:hypothetical protein
MRDPLRDPKKQFYQFQDQIQDRFITIREEIGEKTKIDQWKNTLKYDFHKIQNQIEKLVSEIKKIPK